MFNRSRLHVGPKSTIDAINESLSSGACGKRPTGANTAVFVLLGGIDDGSPPPPMRCSPNWSKSEGRETTPRRLVLAGCVEVLRTARGANPLEEAIVENRRTAEATSSPEFSTKQHLDPTAFSDNTMSPLHGNRPTPQKRAYAMGTSGGSQVFGCARSGHTASARQEHLA